MPRLFLATCASLPELSPQDRPLVPALRALGVEPELVVWDDPAVDWAAADLVLITTTWDYHLKREAFLAWAERVDAVTRLVNPLALLRWNSHKTYLRDLAARGVPIIPTAFLEAPADLRAVMAEHGWTDGVLKPAVSASAQGTLRVGADNLAAGQQHLDLLIAADQTVLLQPYVREVEGHGERALVFLDGAYSHAIRKDPVLSDVGGSIDAYTGVESTPEELAAAAAALATLDPAPFYARVDLVGGNQLMELEVVEPSLYLTVSAEGTARYARAIISKYLNSPQPENRAPAR